MRILVCCCSIVTAAVLLAQPREAIDASQSRQNTLGMKFVTVPGVTVRVSVWETRVRDFRPFVEATRREWMMPDFEQTPDDPAVNVSWEDASAFCEWLTGKERQAGRLGGGQRYRLPTDAEWSAAAGLGAEQGRTPEDRLQASVIWPWGYGWPPQPGDGNYAPELETDTFPNTSPVASFNPNPHGLFDLGGNVWEWCEDWYNDARVTKSLRGASFHDRQPKDLLAAYRFSATVHLSNDDIGFRIVLEDSGAPQP